MTFLIHGPMLPVLFFPIEVGKFSRKKKKCFKYNILRIVFRFSTIEFSHADFDSTFLSLSYQFAGKEKNFTT